LRKKLRREPDRSWGSSFAGKIRVAIRKARNGDGLMAAEQAEQKVAWHMPAKVLTVQLDERP
jgi:hypothetical protein